MLVDHFGLLFCPNILIFRMIGRLALPIFCFGISQGFFYTSNFKKYITRLLAFAVISQLPFSLMRNDFLVLNILFGFILSLFFLRFCNKKNYILASIILILSFIINIEYGAFQIIMTSLFYFFRDKKSLLLITQACLVLLTYPFYTWWFYNLVFLGVLIAIYFPKNKWQIKLPKMFFYWFYPLHILILYITSLIFVK